LIITQHNGSSKTDIIRRRDFSPVEAFAIRRKYPLIIRDDTIDPKNLKRPSKGKLSRIYTVEDIIPHVALDGTPIEKGELKMKANQAGTAQNQVFLLVDRAIAEATLFDRQKQRKGKRSQILISRKPNQRRRHK
jgi:hypothetical protein